MPHIDSFLFDGKKLQKKTLSIVLSEGEGILAAVREAMKQHGIKECTVVDINGKIRDGQITCFDHSQYKTISLKDTELLKASGNMKLSYDELWGSMHIATAGKKTIAGTLVKGNVADGLEIKLTFLEQEKSQSSQAQA